ncbi:MAG: alpha/beta hydrolase, partial [Pseudomonadota bacterium]
MIQSLGQHATQRTLTAKIDWAGRPVHIEYQWIEEAKAETDTPWLIFLHEGLGSISMWRDFPQTLCSALGCRGLVYSR